MMFRWILPVLVMLAAWPVRADPVLNGKAEQGGVLLGQTRPGAVVQLDERTVPVDGQGRFLLGFGRDAAASARLTVDGASHTLTIARRDWAIQRIDGLPSQTVTPDPALQARIAAENALIAERRASFLPAPLFLSGLAAPAEGVVSGVFGSQRILNGEPRSPHSGTDIAAPTGAPVRAVADGVVRLAHPGMVLTGQTVLIDHGLGLQTIYAHLSRTDVAEGDAVRKGQVIGAVGATGRASGAHLHWGASWLDVRLDPQTVLAVLATRPSAATKP